jgi:hypothetical protein
MSIISTAQSITMGFSDQQLANPTNEPLPMPPTSVGAPKFSMEVELMVRNIKLQIERLQLYRKLFQNQSEILKSASETEAKSLEQDLADYWKAVLETDKNFDMLNLSIGRWRREINGESREVYKTFSLNLPKKAEEN